MNLALLAYEMRAAGIKSLALELQDEPSSPPLATDEERPTLAPGDTDAPPKDPELCAHDGCGEKRGGIFNGVGAHLCRTHAFQSAGVRTS
jgi:hypothetical protein